MKKGINLQLFGGMDNPDLEKDNLEIQNEMIEAIQNGDLDAFAASQLALSENIKNNIMDDVKASVNEDLNDRAVMTKRGLNPLTKAETDFYNEVIDGEGFAGVHKLLPPTVFDRVFEYLRREHPLLSRIDFVNTTGTTRWVTRTKDAEAAWWGPLCEEIKKKLSSAFKLEDTGLYKLSAYLPVCKSMLDLGPQWLDRFVREMLRESLAIALEDAIINGDGKDKPIGMMKDLKGSVVEGVYPDKDTKPLTDFSPKSLGTNVMLPLTLDGKRTVNNALMIVNPADYWSKIFGMTTMLTADGKYVYGILPIPADIIQSVAVEEGKMVVGMPRDYFMGVGSEGKIEHSDHYKFLEDERVYITKQYANGKPIENDRFLVFDISELKGISPKPGGEEPEEIPEA